MGHRSIWEQLSRLLLMYTEGMQREGDLWPLGEAAGKADTWIDILYKDNGPSCPKPKLTRISKYI